MTEHNPYSPPTVEISSSEPEEFEYVGFWLRVVATIIDSIIIIIVTLPPLIAIYGVGYFESESAVQGLADFFLSYIFPAIAIILFWIYKQASPGKMAISAIIVDADTGNKPSNGQLVGRYFGYFISSIPLGLGLLWVAFDKRKQGWHDKLAGTSVIKHR